MQGKITTKLGKCREQTHHFCPNTTLVYVYGSCHLDCAVGFDVHDDIEISAILKPTS